MDAIVMEGLSKVYEGGRKAVDSLCLTLRRGEVFGFLGPNGAGKTTTVKLLTGMLAPSAGSCCVCGIDPAREPERVHALSGVVTEHAQMYDTLTGLQNLLFYASVFGVPAGESRERAEGLMERMGLSGAKDKKLSAYSTGMRQKLSLSRALIHRPEVLFLDEPTSGLDPESVQNVNCLIHSLAREQGLTVFLCTHQLRYAQEICTRYGLLEEGRLLACGTLNELCSETLPGITLKIRASRAPRTRPCRRIGESEFEIGIQSEKETPQIVREIVEDGGDVFHVSAIQPSLEDVYFALTGK